MVNIGDTVLVTIRMWEALASFVVDNRMRLQDRLRAAGFRVLAIDDSALSWHSWGQLIVSVQPIASAYGSAYDVASVVNGAALAAGYVGSGDFNGQVVARAESVNNNVPGSAQYEQNLNAPPAVRTPGFDNPFGVSPMILIAGVGLLFVVAMVGGGGRRR